MAAREIIEQCARKKSHVLQADWDIYIKDEHQKEFRRLYKERYNFFKHADNDPDHEVDLTNIQFANDFQIFFNVAAYKELFRRSTSHMETFIIYMLVQHPNWLRQDPDHPLFAHYKSMIATHGGKSRNELCSIFRKALDVHADAQREVREVRSLARAGLVKTPERNANDEGKFFSRRRPTP